MTIICRQRSTHHQSEGIQKTFQCYLVIQKCCILAQALPCDSAWRKTNIVLSTLANLHSLVGISTSNTASFKNVAQIFRAVILNQINGNLGHRNGPIKACHSALYEYLWRHGIFFYFMALSQNHWKKLLFYITVGFIKVIIGSNGSFYFCVIRHQLLICFSDLIIFYIYL